MVFGLSPCYSIELDSRSANPVSTLVVKIQELLTRNWEVKVHHIYREANRTTNLLASLSHSLSISLCVYLEPPFSLVLILSKDLRGVALPCLIC